MMKRVFVPINAGEKIVFCDRLVECFGRRDRLQDELDEEKSRAKTELKKIESEMKDLIEILGRGTEERDIDVDEIVLEESFEIELRRGGTGELVLRRPMTQEELDRLRRPVLPFDHVVGVDPAVPGTDETIETHLTLDETGGVRITKSEPEEDDDEDDEEEPDLDDENQKTQRYPKRRPKKSTPVIKHRRKANSQEIHP